MVRRTCLFTIKIFCGVAKCKTLYRKYGRPDLTIAFLAGGHVVHQRMRNLCHDGKELCVGGRYSLLSLNVQGCLLCLYIPCIQFVHASSRKISRPILGQSIIGKSPACGECNSNTDPDLENLSLDGWSFPPCHSASARNIRYFSHISSSYISSCLERTIINCTKVMYSVYLQTSFPLHQSSHGKVSMVHGLQERLRL
jgi:hypothetical protein